MFEFVAMDHEVLEVVYESWRDGDGVFVRSFLRRRLLEAGDLRLPESMREVWEWSDL